MKGRVHGGNSLKKVETLKYVMPARSGIQAVCVKQRAVIKQNAITRTIKP
jgi:hypothetical protein